MSRTWNKLLIAELDNIIVVLDQTMRCYNMKGQQFRISELITAYYALIMVQIVIPETV